MMLSQNLVVDAALQMLVQNHTFVVAVVVVVVVVLLPFLYLRISQIFYKQKLRSNM